MTDLPRTVKRSLLTSCPLKTPARPDNKRGRTKKLNVCLQCRVCPPLISQLEQTRYKGRENYLIGFRCIIRFWQEYLIEPFQCFWMWLFLWYLLVLPLLKTKVSLNARLKHNILSILSNFLKASCTNGAHIFSKAKKKCEWQIYLFTSTSLKGERETILKFFWHSHAADAHVLLGKGTKSKWHLSSPLHFRADIHPSFANSTFDQNNISQSFPFQIISEATIFVNSALDQLCPSDTDNIIICRQLWCQVNLRYMQCPDFENACYSLGDWIGPLLDRPIQTREYNYICQRMLFDQTILISGQLGFKKRS